MDYYWWFYTSGRLQVDSTVHISLYLWAFWYIGSLVVLWRCDSVVVVCQRYIGGVVVLPSTNPLVSQIMHTRQTYRVNKETDIGHTLDTFHYTPPHYL